MKKTFALSFTGVALCAFSAPAFAQDGAALFKGKTVTYIVATAPGGGYDTYGRIVADFMQKHLPGSTFVVRNMPGAGHLVGTNAINASKPDGLTIGTFNTGLIYNQLINADGVRFDLSKMSWIGKAASESRVVAIASQSPIKTWQDFVALTTPVNFAVAGPGSASYVETIMLANVLKLPLRVQTGYNGTDDQLAMRRGEIVGSIASRSSYDQFVRNGYGRLIAQIGGNDKNLAQLSEVVTDPKAKELLALIESTGEIARLTAGPPAIPAPQLEALRAAYKQAMEDKELIARAEKIGLPVEPL
jgi:tripartite-type tricarboxylate transporter receptor subunit TctC